MEAVFLLSKVKSRVRNIFLTGLIVLLPISITYYVLTVIFQKADRFLTPLIIKVLLALGIAVPKGFQIPGVGAIATIMLVFILGVIATNIFGRKIIDTAETIVNKIPLVRTVYTTAKQILEAFAKPDKSAFTKVVMVEFPRKGIFSLGFVTAEAIKEAQELSSDYLLSVFVPNTPNPTTGFFLMVPQSQLLPINLTVEDAFKLVISGGLITPRENKVITQPEKNNLHKQGVPSINFPLPDTNQPEKS